MNIKATLKKKIAGLPLGLWLLLVVAAIALGLFLRSRSSGRPTAGESEFDSAPIESVPIAGTVGGGAGGGGIGFEPLPPPPAPEGLGARDMIDAFGQGFSMGQGAGGFGFGGSIPSGGGMQDFVPPREAPPPPPSAPPPQSPPPKSGPVPGATFTWAFAPTTYKGEKLPGKTIWKAGDKPLFLKHLGARGQSYATWRANHASAACRVFGDC